VVAKHGLPLKKTKLTSFLKKREMEVKCGAYRNNIPRKSRGKSYLYQLLSIFNWSQIGSPNRSIIQTFCGSLFVA
jgi:hypothetical protein